MMRNLNGRLRRVELSMQDACSERSEVVLDAVVDPLPPFSYARHTRFYSIAGALCRITHVMPCTSLTMRVCKCAQSEFYFSKCTQHLFVCLFLMSDGQVGLIKSSPSDIWSRRWDPPLAQQYDGFGARKADVCQRLLPPHPTPPQ